MAQITSGSLTIVDVTDGAPGLNNTTVFLYRRAVSAPDKPTGNLTYTFSTASITGALEGWVQSISELTGSDPIWMIAAVASSNGETDVIGSSEWAGPIKMAQNGQDGLPGAPGTPGTNGLNQATIFIYKRDDSATAPSKTIYTFANGSFTVPSGWSKTIPTEPKGKPCWVTSAIAISAEATAELKWAAPSVLVEDGSDGVSPTVTKTENGVKIDDGHNVTYITNGKDGTSYYTFVRYSENSDGSGYVDTPTSETIYIGVYTGTKSSPPAYNDSGWTWSRYVGADGQPGTPGSQGPQGVSVAATRELYYLKTNSTDPAQITNANQIHTTDDINQWTSVVPTYIGSGKYYTCIETTLSNGNVVWSAPVENKGLTDANVNAANAIEIARGVKQHFFWVATDKSENIPAGAYVAEQAEESFYSNPTKGNILTRSDGIWIRNGVDKLATLQGGGLTFLVPTGNYKGQRSVSLDGSGLTFYNIGSSNSAAATLASDGLEIINGSIVLGTTSGTDAGNVTLSNKNFERSINGTSHNDLRLAIGSKFGVASDGTLYSSGLESIAAQVESSTNLLLDSDAPNLGKVYADANRYFSDTTRTQIVGTSFELTDPPEKGIQYGRRLVCDGTNTSLMGRAYAFYNSTDNVIPFVPNTTYTATWWARCTEGQGYTRFHHSLFDGSTQSGISDDVELTSEWQRFTHVFTTGSIPNTNYNRVWFYARFPANTAGTVEICGCKLIVGDAVEQYKTTIEQTANNVLIKATEFDITAAQGGQHIIESLINVAPSGVQIAASKVDIAGAAVFNNYSTTSDMNDAIGDAVDGIEVGGRNRILFSGSHDGYINTNAPNWDGETLAGTWTQDGYLTKTRTAGQALMYAFSRYISDNGKLSAGTYTLSATIRSTAPYVTLQVYRYTDSLVSIISKSVISSGGNDNKWTKYSHTFTTTEDYENVFCRVVWGGEAGTVDFKEWKLEKGNKATDWSPAPEDVQAEIDAVDTKADGANSQEQRIYYRSNSTTAPTAPSTWVTSTSTANATWSTKRMQYDSTYKYLYTCIQRKTVGGTISNSTVLLDDTTTVIDGGNIITGTVAANAVDAASGTFNTANIPNLNASKITAGDISADRMKVNSISAINSNTGSVKISASKVEIDGTATFNAIKSSTDAAYDAKGAAQTAVDGIEVGGRNLIENTNQQGVSPASENNSAYVSPTPRLTDYGLSVLNNTETWWTYSFDYEVTGNTAEEGYIYVQAKGAMASGSSWLIKDRPSGHYVKSFKLTSSQVSATSDSCNIRLRNATDGAVLTVKNIKLEKGNKETDWSPAPEDVQSEIDAKKSVHTLDTAYSYTYANILTFSAEGYGGTSGANWTVSSTSGVKAGDTVRLKVTVSDMSNAPVYVVGTVTAVTSGTVLKMTSHGLDTTIIDGGNILTNSIGANKIKVSEIEIGAAQITSGTIATARIPNLSAAKITSGTLDAARIGANSIGADKIKVNEITIGASQVGSGTFDPDRYGAESITTNKLIQGDFNNYITVNENKEETLASGAIIEDGWIYKNVATSTNAWLSSTRPQWAKEGEQYRVTGKVKTKVAGKVRIVIYGRTSTGSASGSAYTSWVTTKANTETEFSGVIKITSGIVAQPRINIVIQFQDSSGTNIVGYCKEMRCERIGPYITQINENGIRIHPAATEDNSVVINADGMEVFKGGTGSANSVAFYGDTARIGKESGSHILLASDSMSMSDGNKDVFNLIQKTMYIYWTRNYKGRQFTNSTDRHIDSWDTNASASTWTSLEVNYKLNNTSKKKTITSISNGVLANDEIYIKFNYSGTIVTLTYGRGESAASTAVIKLESATIRYITDEQLSEMITGAYSDTTLSGAFRIGNGKSNSDHRNVMLVDWGGNAKFRGDVLAFCNPNSSGGMSLTKTEENLEICTQSDSKGTVTIDSYRVGRMVVLRIHMELAGTTAAGQRINTVSLSGKHLPKPLGNSASGASYYGTHSIGLFLNYNSSASRYEIAIHNASSTAFTPVSGYDLYGTLTYICEMDSFGNIEYVDD